MSVANLYDAVVIGAGPAGAMLAYLLAKAGVKVLILEKMKLPRYKPCGGGLTRRAIDLLPFNLDGIIEESCHTVIMSSGNKPFYCKKSEIPILHMVMRDKFDHFLVEKAVAEGAELNESVSFLSLSGVPGSITVKTTAGMFKTRVIVGADGVHSRVASALNLKTASSFVFALESEVYCQEARLLNGFTGTAHFDFDVIPGGYGWIFPKSEHLSVGVGSFFQKVKDIKRWFWQYLTDKGMNDGAVVRSLTAHLIPWPNVKRNIVANDKGLLIGDAAGITDPVTGEGIFFALKEAYLAAEVITDAMEFGPVRLNQYNRILKSVFKDLNMARRLSRVFYSHPHLRQWLLRNLGRKLGDIMVEIASGRKSYYQQLIKILNPLRFLPASSKRQL